MTPHQFPFTTVMCPGKVLDSNARYSAISLAQPLASEDDGSRFGLAGLTHDVWDGVVGYLYPPDLLSLAQVNSSLFDVVTTSLPWRFYKNLFPTSRPIWALSWKDAHMGYFSRTCPPHGKERVTYSLTDAVGLPQTERFLSLFKDTHRRVIEFFGPSVRHRHDVYLTQLEHNFHVCRSWKITSAPEYAMGEVNSVTKVSVQLPPGGHHLRPAGLDLVGTSLFWVEYADAPIKYTLSAENGIGFEEGFGEMALWPDRAFEGRGEPSLLKGLFLSWGEAQFGFSGQMACATPTVRQGGRKQVLRLYDYQTRRIYSLPFEMIIKQQGPWLGKWRAPWILPWGFDDDENLLFKIVDTRIVNGQERLRCVQTSFNLETMKTTFSVEILEDILLLSPWNFQLFSDQCWAYPVRDSVGNIWCILRDLRDGNLVQRVGPLNRPRTLPTDFSVHISMYHVIFQDKSPRLESCSVPSRTPLRVFPINPVPHHVLRNYHFRTPERGTSLCLYELEAPSHPFPPGFWMFGGEDASERYLFFQGSALKLEDTQRHEDWKKWAVWDSFKREWSVLQCHREWGADGFYCLFKETDREGKERVGLDWVTL
jgi:hypothetical protein